MTYKNKDLQGFSSRKQSLADLKTNPGLFQPRRMGLDEDQVQAIVRALRRGSSLEPLDCWRDGKDVIWLVHGHHRLAALLKLGRKKHNIRIHSGTLAEVRLLSIASNSHDRLPLSTSERTQFAWRLHCDHGQTYSIATLARAAGISPKTVVNMRGAHSTLVLSGVEPHERWIDAREAASSNKRDFPEADRDAIFAERKRWLSDKISGPIKHEAKRDPSMVFSILIGSFGKDAFAREAAKHGYHLGDYDPMLEVFTPASAQEAPDNTPFGA